MAKSLIEIDEELLINAALVFHTDDADSTVSKALSEAVERERPMHGAAPADMSFLHPTTSADYVAHVWDENGHL